MSNYLLTLLTTLNKTTLLNFFLENMSILNKIFEIYKTAMYYFRFLTVSSALFIIIFAFLRSCFRFTRFFCLKTLFQLI